MRLASKPGSWVSPASVTVTDSLSVSACPHLIQAACLVEGSASLRKRLDAAHGSARGGCGRGLMLRDLSLASAGLECSAVLSLHRGADQPAQLNKLGTYRNPGSGTA